MKLLNSMLSLFHNRRRPTRRADRNVRLHLENLEDRLVPSTITVNSYLDPAPSTVLPAGTVTLRSAVNQANLDASHGTSDTILFNLPKPLPAFPTITLEQGPLELKPGTGTVTIIGAGADGDTISGNNKYEVFKVDAGAKVALNHLEIGYGHTALYGGGIYNDGSLTLTQVFLGYDSAAFGGGLFNDVSGNLTATADVAEADVCTFAFNSATASGGGIYNDGRMSLVGSMISENSAGWGGGLFNALGSYGVTLSNCNLFGNSATYDGGAIVNCTAMTIESNCVFSGNRTNGDGGAIANEGTLTVSNCSFVSNTASYGSAFYNFPGGVLTVSASSGVGNSSTYGPADIDNLGTEDLLGSNPGL
jgi:predicted outer membrane repeat protein